MEISLTDINGRFSWTLNNPTFLLNDAADKSDFSAAADTTALILKEARLAKSLVKVLEESLKSSQVTRDTEEVWLSLRCPQQNRPSCSANYHSEDAAICYFQSASQQRGMKRAESQREHRLHSFSGSRSH